MTKKESVVHTPVVILKTVRKAPTAITSPELTCMSLNIYSLTPLTLHAAEVIGWFLPPKIFQHFSKVLENVTSVYLLTLGMVKTPCNLAVLINLLLNLGMSVAKNS